MAEPIPIPTNPSFQDLAGCRFGRILVVSYAGVEANRIHHRWNCRCDCGHEWTVRSNCLRVGDTTSCGCLARDKLVARTKTHGMTHRPEYWVWAAMRNRCDNPNDQGYHNYGGRGIRHCEHFSTFAGFIGVMGLRPTPKHTIERIDNDRGYECGQCDDCKNRGATLNCRWATRREQALNNRRNHHITIDGVTKTVTEWAEQYGLNYKMIYFRLSRGWDERRAVTTPRRVWPIRPSGSCRS